MTSPNLYSIREVEVTYKVREEIPQGIPLSGSMAVYKTFRDFMLAQRVELFMCLMLNAKNRTLDYEIVSRGSLSSGVVHPREVFTTPVRNQAASVLFMHNHPSGDSAPSREDRECTERLVKAGIILGIKVTDHIIFGTSDYYSFADCAQIKNDYPFHSIIPEDLFPSY